MKAKDIGDGVVGRASAQKWEVGGGRFDAGWVVQLGWIQEHMA